MAVLRPASSAPAEVDEDFERDFAQLMQDFQGVRPAATAAAAARQPQQQLGAGPVGEPDSEDNSMVFKVGQDLWRCCRACCQVLGVGAAPAGPARKCCLPSCDLLQPSSLGA